MATGSGIPVLQGGEDVNGPSISTSGDVIDITSHQSSTACTCGRICVGNEVTEARNLNLDCPDHGTASEWYNSPEQKTSRAAFDDQLRRLQAKARAARTLHDGCPSGDALDPVGKCNVCDLAREILDEWAK